jgi:heme exporter protein D
MSYALTPSLSLSLSPHSFVSTTVVALVVLVVLVVFFLPRRIKEERKEKKRKETLKDHRSMSLQSAERA